MMVKPARIDGLPTLDYVLVFDFFKMKLNVLRPRAGQSDTSTPV